MNIIQRGLSNKTFTYATKGIMGAVVFTTILRGTSRPALIMADKKADPETKKYTAGKELLYQGLCLLLTFGMVIPAQILAFKKAKNYMKSPELKDFIKNYGDFKKVNMDIDEFTKKGAEVLGRKENETFKSPDAKSEFKLVKGAMELVSFISSIIGLTIVAPAVGNKIIHPMLKKMGWAAEEKSAAQKIDAKA